MSHIINGPQDVSLQRLWQLIKELQSTMWFECAHCHQVSGALFAQSKENVVRNGYVLYCEHCEKTTLLCLVTYAEGQKGTIGIKIQ